MSKPFGLDAHRMFWEKLLRAGVVCIEFPAIGNRDMRVRSADLRHFKDNVEAWQKERENTWHTVGFEWRIQRATEALEANKKEYESLLAKMLKHHLHQLEFV